MANELKTVRWNNLREFVLRRDMYLDQEAKRYGKRITANTVHHIFPREYFPQYTYAAWNLISLSHKTHNTMHDRASHKLTQKGWELLMKTAKSQGIEISDGLKAVICA